MHTVWLNFKNGSSQKGEDATDITQHNILQTFQKWGKGRASEPVTTQTGKGNIAFWRSTGQQWGWNNSSPQTNYYYSHNLG